MKSVLPTRSLLALAGLSLAVACQGGTQPDSGDILPPGEFHTLTGDEASAFSIPPDSVLVATRPMPHAGLNYERYQQMVGSAEVLGGQITIHRASNGNAKTVLGTHYQIDVNTAVNNAVSLSEADAIAIASARVPDATEHAASLMFAPDSGRFFFAVESRSDDALRRATWIDAEDASIINAFDMLTSACNYSPGGVGFDGTQVDLGSKTSGSLLQNARITTRDLGSWKRPFYGTADQDTDGCWDRAGRTSPGQGALVSAHQNVALTDDYYQNTFGFDLVAAGGLSNLQVWGHYGVNYVNAYWDGTKMVFGDGDGVSYRELVAIDIAAHELSHGVTEFNSGLIYQNESGALNEAFSDIMGATVGFVTGLDADWLMGDDSDLAGQGFRNMADPTAYSNSLTGPYPAHYCDRYTGTSDNGGVHINSSIANHAYYLLVSGGVPLADAAQIFYDGFAALTNNAQFLDARTATVAVAGESAAAVEAAWTAVGVYAGVDCGTNPPAGCSSAADCSDSDTCTDDVCNADGTCSNPDNGACGTCAPSNQSCTADDQCCSGRCRTKGSKANTCT